MAAAIVIGEVVRERIIENMLSLEISVGFIFSISQLIWLYGVNEFVVLSHFFSSLHSQVSAQAFCLLRRK